MDKPFPTRIEADAEGNAIVLTIYAHMLSTTIELSPADGRLLVAAISQAVALIEDSNHVED